MTEENHDPEAPAAKRGRPAGKAKAKRQNYADDLRQLQDHVRIAAGLLQSAKDAKSNDVTLALIDEAIKFLVQE